MMKILATIALLLLLGCQGKPKPLPVLTQGSYCGQRYLDADCPAGWYVDSDHKRWPKWLLDTADEHTLRIFHESQFCRPATTRDYLAMAELSTQCRNVHQEATWLPNQPESDSGSISHVSHAQWEAAQGLYVNVRIGCDDPHHTVEGCREIIFDPSKAAK